MFAKLYGPEADQVLVTLMQSDAGRLQVRIHHQAAGLAVSTVFRSYELSAAGLSDARAAFDALDEQSARAVADEVGRAGQAGGWQTLHEGPAFLDELPPGAALPSRWS